MESDREQLLEELDAIDAIYPDLMDRKVDDSSIILIKVPQHEHITIQVSFPQKYPSIEAPHILEVIVSNSAKRQDLYDIKYLQNLFQEVMDSNFHQGSVCFFDFLTELDAVLYMGEEEAANDESNDVGRVNRLELIPTDPFEGWIASDPITDRASTFMAFAAHVDSEAQAFAMLERLKTDTKIKKCAHVMSAWRIKVPSERNKDQVITYQDSDDDGEAAAGSRMLHLITIMDVWNVMVVVGRWFGGTHIGPDRFKHINSTAREAVLRAGFERQA
ncbi:hypothetical protein KAFR_0J02560 [Kazachstania africana CBS 2517]|uniref:RWD domain-containing protein n=1 Tax=Kazachstania africana (strain ATCC 22294 / BCRC 22015 / CBS 2517 / CECT 1963 / NBRC 1671 / NRRL Y-8276) TaxID=1071382 RepID=H2B120_KAZAF|nr:hypothetical protein KAFR_0J02560 [Kazachstania africana CBS 2517]CCF60320.1 hypothetical protein KAFR_0J02560 [Kazachstania africana CBS 2517]